VKLPQGEAIKEATDEFDRLGFPQVVGAIDGSHIPIVRHNENATDFHNRICFHSILLQGVVDHRGIFIDIYVGWRPDKFMMPRYSAFSKKGRMANCFPIFPNNLEVFKFLNKSCDRKCIWAIKGQMALSTKMN